VIVTVRRGVGLRTSSLCKDGGASPVGEQSWVSGLQDTSHGRGAIGGASPGAGVGVVWPSKGDAASGIAEGMVRVVQSESEMEVLTVSPRTLTTAIAEKVVLICPFDAP